MIRPPRTWSPEQNDRRVVFAVGDRATLFTESAAFQVTRHGPPVWKVVLPIGGHALIRPEGGRTVAAPGLLVPPRLVHTCAATSAYAALFIEPWLIPPGPGPVRLDVGTVRRLLAALGPVGVCGPAAAPHPDAAYDELVALTGRPLALDTRVTHALRETADAGVARSSPRAPRNSSRPTRARTPGGS
ncbi:hypothetical protein ACH4U7_41250 [Streptomyces sp. NPDC020845]|uniref:hypothetical protein n=1 Tax=Streptomyces sp. NPDC020845 TaxID=3365096 RepID=UPI00378CB035